MHVSPGDSSIYVESGGSIGFRANTYLDSPLNWQLVPLGIPPAAGLGQVNDVGVYTAPQTSESFWVQVLANSQSNPDVFNGWYVNVEPESAADVLPTNWMSPINMLDPNPKFRLRFHAPWLPRTMSSTSPFRARRACVTSCDIRFRPPIFST